MSPRFLLAAALLTACGAAQTQEPRPAESGNEKLDHGYGLLYEAASGLRYVDEILYVKFESEEAERVLEDISDYAAQLSEDLENLAERDSEISIDDPGLPQVELEARKSANLERLGSLAPLVGMSGKDFERTLLLTQSGALNQQRHLSKTLREAESDPERRRFLDTVVREYDEIYRRVVNLLDEKYFSNTLPRGGSDAHTEVPEL